MQTRKLNGLACSLSRHAGSGKALNVCKAGGDRGRNVFSRPSITYCHFPEVCADPDVTIESLNGIPIWRAEGDVRVYRARRGDKAFSFKVAR